MKILAIRGVLDSSTGHRFERSLMELLREHREPIGLDFSGLKYMTSAGVASFLRVSQKAKERNSQLAIIRPSQEVGMMLDFLGISKHVPIFETEEDMRAAMPERRESLDVVERTSLGGSGNGGGSYTGRQGGNPGGSSMDRPAATETRGEVRGGILPPAGYESSASVSQHSHALSSGTGPSDSQSILRPGSGLSEGPADAYYMGESIGRLSETLDGLTRNLKSLGKTMEDLQRTEHSLKEEFERERSVRKQRKAARVSSDRSFDFSDAPSADAGRAHSAGETGGRLSGGPSSGSAVEVPARELPMPQSSLRENSGAPAARSAPEGGRPGVSGAGLRSAYQNQPAEMNRIIECEQCGSKLRIYHAGRHLCPACKIEFEVETDGSTSYYEKLATS